MKQSPVISLMMLIGCFQSLAAQDNKRFVEFQERGLTQTYDLSTVQMLQPGRFTIVSTQIDDADVMKLELKVLDTLRTYCKEPDGKYPAPTDLFALGPPDLPIATIDVQSYSSGLKYAFWYYPYDRLAGHLVNGRVVQKEMDLQCKDGLAVERAIVTPATICDHVEPHHGDVNKFWLGPFQSLCKPPAARTPAL
jgi:hypothetical protein